jgi:uncharacterized membrane protein YgcG
MTTFLSIAIWDSGFPAFLHTMKGPQFLIVYVLWFWLLFGALWILRRRGFERPFVDFIAALLFIGLGVARIIIGSAYGLHKFELLILLMIVGTIFLSSRLDRTGGGKSGSSNWWSSCSSGGGCGSGGCGGGGCGGCGG